MRNINCLAVFLFVSFVLTSHLEGANQSTESTASFRDRFDQAYYYGQVGKFNKSFAAFKKLLQTNPNEFIVYDFYAKTLESNENYRGAIGVYRNWLAQSGSGDAEKIKFVAARIDDLKRKKAFAKEMVHLESWESAAVVGTREFAVKTNLPKKYRDEVLEELRTIIQQEKNILSQIFGYQIDQTAWMKVYIVCKKEDYQKALHELKQDQIKMRPATFYLSETNDVFIFFDGVIDKMTLTHGTASHLIRNHYIKNPSNLLEAGMTDYISYQLIKPYAKTWLLDNLELMNWLYDQSGWEDALEVFSLWKSLLALNQRQFFMDAKEYKDYWQIVRVFYLRAWTLIDFFIEGKNPFFKDFFKRYLLYEKGNSNNNYVTALKFFRKNLTKDQLHELNNQWVKFTLNVTFENI